MEPLRCRNQACGSLTIQADLPMQVWLADIGGESMDRREHSRWHILRDQVNFSDNQCGCRDIVRLIDSPWKEEWRKGENS